MPMGSPRRLAGPFPDLDNLSAMEYLVHAEDEIRPGRQGRVVHHLSHNHYLVIFIEADLFVPQWACGKLNPAGAVAQNELIARGVDDSAAYGNGSTRRIRGAHIGDGSDFHVRQYALDNDSGRDRHGNNHNRKLPKQFHTTSFRVKNTYLDNSASQTREFDVDDCAL